MMLRGLPRWPLWCWLVLTAVLYAQVHARMLYHVWIGTWPGATLLDGLWRGWRVEAITFAILAPAAVFGVGVVWLYKAYFIPSIKRSMQRYREARGR